MIENIFGIKGLTPVQVLSARKKYGYNSVNYKKESGIISALISLVREPMVILLFITALIYFISGNVGDGLFLSCSIVLVLLFHCIRIQGAETH
ncbi:cation-transporting P-type ATPase [Pedobacter sp. NJ-S-72]